MADIEMNGRPWGLSPYESFKVSEMNSRRPSGTAIAGLTVASIAAALGVGAWIFGPIVSNNRSKGIEKLVEVNNSNTQNTLDRLINALAGERAERVAQGVTLTQTVTDTVSGSQQGTLTAQQAAELSSIQSVQQNLLNQAVLGNLSQAPQKVAIYQDAMPCGCNSCNG
jgi:hypothetical protein